MPWRRIQQNGNGNGSKLRTPIPTPAGRDLAIGPKRDKTVASVASLLVTQPGTPLGYVESFNQLFANLALSYRPGPLSVVVITSPLPGEGKTLSAINFALVGASWGLRMLLVDADLRSGIVSTVLGCERTPGFAELLAGTATPDEALRVVSLGEHRSIVAVPSGELLKDGERVLTLDRARKVLGELATGFDCVVVDSPPVNLLSDAAVLGSAADAVVLVVRAGHTRSEDLRYAMDQLAAAGAPYMGTLLNDIDLRHGAREEGAYRYVAQGEPPHAGVS